MRIDELMDKGYPITKIDDHSHRKSHAAETAGGDVVRVEFHQVEPKTVAVKKSDGIGTRRIQVNSWELTFDRAVLYKRLAGMIAKQYGYTVNSPTNPNGTVFSLLRNDIK